jgi:predicted P-loop ATPase
VELVFSVHARVGRYLTHLTWDEIPRIDQWLSTCLGADGNPEYLKAIGPRFLISAVARALRPGCKADQVLVLEGAQGIGKSTAVRVLSEPWTTDSLPDLTSKEAAIQIQGVWIVELAELTSMSRSDVEHIKAFMSRNEDRYRPHWGRSSETRPRRCVFIATTNLQGYLRDETGNRRFWPVRCRSIDLERLRGIATSCGLRPFTASTSEKSGTSRSRSHPVPRHVQARRGGGVSRRPRALDSGQLMRFTGTCLI